MAVNRLSLKSVISYAKTYHSCKISVFSRNNSKKGVTKCQNSVLTMCMNTFNSSIRQNSVTEQKSQTIFAWLF